MPRLRIKTLTWLMSIGVFIWFIVYLFSEADDCTYDLDDNYYYETQQELNEQQKNSELKQHVSVYGPNRPDVLSVNLVTRNLA